MLCPCHSFMRCSTCLPGSAKKGGRDPAAASEGLYRQSAIGCRVLQVMGKTGAATPPRLWHQSLTGNAGMGCNGGSQQAAGNQSYKHTRHSTSLLGCSPKQRACMPILGALLVWADLSPCRCRPQLTPECCGCRWTKRTSPAPQQREPPRHFAGWPHLCSASSR